MNRRARTSLFLVGAVAGMAVIPMLPDRTGQRVESIQWEVKARWEDSLHAVSAAGKYVLWGPDLDLAETERLVVEITNGERVKGGLAPLRHDAAISEISRGHSADMARLDIFSHELMGRDPTGRALAAGYNCRAYRGDGSYTYGLSENIYEYPKGGRNAEGVAKALVQGWMDSPGHRRNIMDRDARRIGVGVVERSGTVFATQNFSECR